jgi:hypothetical protein
MTALATIVSHRIATIIGGIHPESLGTDSPFFDRFRRSRPCKTCSVQKNFCIAHAFISISVNERCRHARARFDLRVAIKKKIRRCIKKPYFIARFCTSRFAAVMCAAGGVCDVTSATCAKSLRVNTFSVRVMYTLR